MNEDATPDVDDEQTVPVDYEDDIESGYANNDSLLTENVVAVDVSFIYNRHSHRLL